MSVSESIISGEGKIRKDANVVWADNLRALATVSVILLHVGAGILSKYGQVPGMIWITGNFYDSLVRACVPVFVMLSGAFLLTRDIPSIQAFLHKRLTRILIPFLLWSFLYIFLYNELSEIDLRLIAKNLWQGSSFHFWYVYMLIGLYFFIPIILKWVRHSTQNEILYFLFIWLVALFFVPLVDTKFKMPLDLTYFSGFLGYLILGYFLATFKLKGSPLVLATILFITGFLLTFLGTHYLTRWMGYFTGHLYDYLTVNVALMAAGVFIFYRNFPFSSTSLFSKIGGFLAKYSYGIYLVHILVLDKILQPFNINYMFVHPVIGIPVTALACTVISALLIYLLTKLPYVGRYVN